MSTPIMWCFNWMSWIPSTPSYVKPSSKNFESQKASCISFSPSYPFMPFDFFCSLVITPFWEICQSYQSSFCLWACIELTPLQGLFLCSLIFMFCIVFQTFFSLVFSLPLLMKSICSALPMLFPFHLIILFLNQLIWNWLFSLASA
jgi:hypothetical protein